MKKSIIILLSGAMFLIFSCAPTIQNTEANPQTKENGNIPQIGFNIPDSLSSGATVTANGNKQFSLSMSTESNSSATNTNGVFEPFRFSLKFGKICIDSVNEIINNLNKNEVPDSFSYTNDKNEKITGSYDTSREYAKRIEFFNAKGEKVLQINYNKGIVKGTAIFDAKALDPSSSVDRIHIFYDGTDINNKILEGSLSFTRQDNSSTECFPKKMYFHAFKQSDKVTMNGGITFNYFFGDITKNPVNYTDNHIYMFQSIADIGSGKAIVNLYFPLSASTGVNSSTDSTDKSFEKIVWKWVNYPANINIQNILVSCAIPYDTAANLKVGLKNWRTAHPDATDCDTLLFLLNLSNPIAYNNSIGYVANGSTVTSDYLNIGNPDNLGFNLTPVGISNISINFLP